eukprot:185923-Pleurochrysis_carterae.AAC.3
MLTCPSKTDPGASEAFVRTSEWQNLVEKARVERRTSHSRHLTSSSLLVRVQQRSREGCAPRLARPQAGCAAVRAGLSGL